MAALGKYLTVAEAAERLGVSGTRAYQFIAEGRLKAVRFGGKALLVDARAVATFKRQPTGRRPVKKPPKPKAKGVRQ